MDERWSRLNGEVCKYNEIFMNEMVDWETWNARDVMCEEVMGQSSRDEESKEETVLLRNVFLKKQV